MGNILNNDCLTKEDLRLFLTADISAAEREASELHLADCQHCRRQVATMFAEDADGSDSFSAPAFLVEQVKALPDKTAIPYSQPRSSFTARRSFWQVAFAVSLLVCFGFAGIYFLGPKPESTTDTLRSGSGSGGSVRLITPASGAGVSDRSLEFRWAPVPKGKSYTLVVSDETGDVVFEQATAQDAVSFDTSGLKAGKHYFWFVRAKLENGTNLESDTAKFLFVK